MKLFGVYESAVYYFDKAARHTANGEPELAVDSVTKGYKHVDGTPIVRETKVRKHTETAVNALDEERMDAAKEQLDDLISLVEDEQHKVLQSVSS